MHPVPVCRDCTQLRFAIGVRTRILYGSICLALASAGPLLPALAADIPPVVVTQESDTWQFSASVYGWFAGIGGTVNFPVAGTGTNFNVDAKTLLNHLELAAAGTFDVHKGPWGVFTDVMYLDLGGASRIRATSRSTTPQFPPAPLRIFTSA